MLGRTRLVNNTWVNQSSYLKTTSDVLNLSSLPFQTSRLAGSDLVMEEEINKQLRNLPDTIISLQYNPDEFLTFRVCTVSQGEIIRSATQSIGLKCRIGGKTYIFNREHLNQMSNRERRELFNYLGVNGSELLLD